MNILNDDLVRGCICVEAREENNKRWGERLLLPIMPDGPLNEHGDLDPRHVIAIRFDEVYVEKVMLRNFSGLADYEQENGLKKLSTREYQNRGLTNRVPWRLETLNSPCPFTKGRLVRHSHFLILMEVAPWEGEIPDDGDAVWKLEWVLRLKGSPLNVDEAKSLELPPEYKKLLVIDKEENVRVLITRKPDEIK